MSKFTVRPISIVAEELGLRPEHVEPFGKGKAKIDLAAIDRDAQRARARLILVSAINPTPAGEGKTTTSIALAMGMRRIGKNVVLALRQPSLGPVFGVKGGGTGGGAASLVPSDDINLHFTGDIHAVTTAHNLLSALVDNAIYYREKIRESEIDPRLVSWGRALDMNDRFLRNVIVGLGGKAHGTPREDRFDITAASEVMAVLALAKDYDDLEKRLSRVLVGATHDGKPVTAGDVAAPSAMTAVLRSALKPNLVQTAGGGPAFVHCGPFGNIAHGCNSVLATRLAMQTGDYAITEGGFGFDLGGEKFLDIKCREMGVFPRAVVIVATLRALKMHGGAPVKKALEPNREALTKGIAHLEKHLENAAVFGLKPIVALNVFPQDAQDELALVREAAGKLGAVVAPSEGFTRGGEGATELAERVCEIADATDADPPRPRFLYELGDPAEEKIEKIARSMYGAKDVAIIPAAKKGLDRARELGYGALPICMAKTQLSLSDDPTVVGRPRDFTVTVREVRVCAGAGFIVALTGEMMTMPGLPRAPASRNIRLLPTGEIKGLMQND